MWGWNVSTIGFFIVMCTTVVEMWGVGNQILTLYDPATHSAAGVSVTQKLLASIFYFAVFNHGRKNHLLGLTIAPACIALSLTLLNFSLLIVKGFTWYEWLVAWVAVVAIALSFTDQWGERVFNGIIGVIFFVLALQPTEMWLRASAEGLNPRDPVSFMVSTSAWIFYGLVTKDKKIWISSASYFCVYTTTLILWLYFTNH